MISSEMAPERSELPEWFLTRWGGFITFNSCWSTETEFKYYDFFDYLKKDIEKLLNEITVFDFRIIFLSDFGDSSEIYLWEIVDNELFEKVTNTYEFEEVRPF
tara:strand:- start:56 stop:364 length:309 start_codon:yes stop_codon:yes gene_type:complete